MKILIALCVSIAVLLQMTAAPAQPAAAAPEKGAEAAALEKKLLGAWRGAPCAGDYTFKADGTYECRNFTPGQNTLTGTWSVRWDALPPTLVLVCKTSDFTKRDTGRAEYEYVGKPRELRLVELNDRRWSYQYPNDKFVWRNDSGKAGDQE